MCCVVVAAIIPGTASIMNPVKRTVLAIIGFAFLVVVQLVYTSDIFYETSKSQSTAGIQSSLPAEAEADATAEAEAKTRIYKWTEPCTFQRKQSQWQWQSQSHSKSNNDNHNDNNNNNNFKYVPIILMSLGRSGSSITWDTLSALTGQRNVAYEITGGNPNTSREFFNSLQCMANASSVSSVSSIGSSSSSSSSSNCDFVHANADGIKMDDGDEHQIIEGDSSGTTSSTLDQYKNWTNWTLQELCHVQRKWRKDRLDITDETAIIGFQWKPFISSWKHPFAIYGLEAIRESNRLALQAQTQTQTQTQKGSNVIDVSAPEVKIIYLTRNALDRKVSNLRHALRKKAVTNTNTKTNTSTNLSIPIPIPIPAHCAIGDEACIAKHDQATTTQNIVFPTGRPLLKWLRNFDRQDRNIVNRLKDMNIPFVQVTYEKLYNVGIEVGSKEENSEEWMRVFRFLNVGPQEGLTMDEVRGAFSMASTSKRSRNETIDNFEEVKDTLIGTEFEYLLSN